MALMTANLTIDAGATFRSTFEFLQPDDSPLDLTGYHARLQARRSLQHPPFIDVSDGSGLLIDGPNGRVTLLLAATDTETFPPGRSVFDLELHGGQEVIRAVEGTITVRPEVTRG